MEKKLICHFPEVQILLETWRKHLRPSQPQTRPGNSLFSPKEHQLYIYSVHADMHLRAHFLFVIPNSNLDFFQLKKKDFIY